MTPIKLALIGAACTALTACATTSGVTVVDRNTPVAVPVNPPAPMNLGEVNWRVLDIAGLKKLVAELELRGGDVVVYVMDKGNYEVLAMNLAEMKRYIADQDAESTQLREAIKINAGTKEPKSEVPKKKKRFGIF